MTQTQNLGPLPGTTEPGWRPELDQTARPVQNENPTGIENEAPGLVLGLDRPQNQNENEIQNGGPADGATKIANGGSVLDSAQNENEIQTETETPRLRIRRPRYPGNLITRHRLARAARRLAEDEAIERGAEAELLLLEAAAAGEIDPEETHARWEKFAAGWPQMALAVAVSIMASVGQIQFAETVGATGMIWLFHHDITPYFAPAVFDLSVAGLYSRGIYVAVRYQASPWLAWAAGTAIGLFSVYTNTQHKGGLFFAAASAVLLISWLVSLIYKYRGLPHVKSRASSAKPRILTSSLVFANLPTAWRAWIIARRRPIAFCTAQLAKQGEKITERDLVISCAELWRTVHADRLIAEQASIPDLPADANRTLRQAYKTKMRQARKRAQLVAWDAVDARLGLVVIKREGIQVNRITYVEPEPAPLPTRSPIRATTDVQAPSASARPRPPAQPAPSLPAARAPEAAPVQILAPGQPIGRAGDNWKPLDQINNLRMEVPAGLACRCNKNPEKWCGHALRDHAQRVGTYLDAIFTAIEEWNTRDGRVTKTEITEICGITGGETISRIGWVIDQLRDLTMTSDTEDAVDAVLVNAAEGAPASN